MKRRVLIWLESDPRQSPRPAEAIRIAAGLAVSPKLEPVLYLSAPALGVLGDEAEDWPDGDNYLQYLPLLARHSVPIWVPAGRAPSPDSSGPGPDWRFEGITEAELATRAASCHTLLRF